MSPQNAETYNEDIAFPWYAIVAIVCSLTAIGLIIAFIARSMRKQRGRSVQKSTGVRRSYSHLGASTDVPSLHKPLLTKAERKLVRISFCQLSLIIEDNEQDPGQEGEGQEDSGLGNSGQEDERQEDEGQADEGREDEGQADEGQEDEGQEDEGQADEGQESKKEHKLWERIDSDNNNNILEQIKAVRNGYCNCNDNDNIASNINPSNTNIIVNNINNNSNHKKKGRRGVAWRRGSIFLLIFVL